MFEENILNDGSFNYLKKFKMNEKLTIGDGIKIVLKKTKIKWTLNILTNVLLFPLGKTTKLTYLKMSDSFLKSYTENGLNFALDKVSRYTKIKYRTHYNYQKYRKHLGLSIVTLDIYLIYMAMLYNLDLEYKKAEEAYMLSQRNFPIRLINEILLNTSEVKKQILLRETLKDFRNIEDRDPTNEELKAIQSVIYPQ